MEKIKITLIRFMNIFLLSIILIGVLIFLVDGESKEIGSIQDQEGVNISLNSFNDILGVVKLNESPDYAIIRSELPVSEGISSPGKSIHPEISLKNEGKTDPESRGLVIDAYLNTTPLTRISVMINPPGGGEEKSYSLVYKLPETMEFGRYKLYLVLDPVNNMMDSNATNNLGSPGGMMSIIPPDDDTFIGCEACWKDYR